MAVAGKVAITLSTENGGAWSADVTYDRLVAVKHNNNLYISRKTVANVEPPNDEFWFLALEGFGGDDVEAMIQQINALNVAIEEILDGTTQVGNAKTLDGNSENVFAKAVDLANYLLLDGGGTVSSNNDTPFSMKSKTSKAVYQRFINSEGREIYFGFDENGEAKAIGKGIFLHTGNKPTGSYTGNEDATERTIPTGGTGNVVIIYSSYGVAIVTTNISLLIGSDGSVTKSNDVDFASDGVIRIKTNNKIVNGLGTLRYTYV